ncbi:MAG: FAD-binding oxidoreductase, partial [Desulfobacterales bacterium]|nr:FAD-binding oxidoreductase [Desulfobacterales bacterium]
MPQSSKFQPTWSDRLPSPGSFRSIFKWGAPDGFKHPNARLFALLKKELQLTDHDFAEKKLPGNAAAAVDTRPAIAPEKIAALTAIVGADNVDTGDFARIKFSTGKTSEEAMRLRRGNARNVADLALHPRDKADVLEIVAYCHREKIPITVYGGGSSVTFGLASGPGGIVLVMATHMHRKLAFNETDRTITVEPGMLGPALEDQLNRAPELLGARHAYTCGHFPQSFEYSSVGGWIAALGSGQQSSYYGDAYDLVLGQEYVTPTGHIKTLVYPGTATGPKVNDILKGSEGAFGVLVGVTLKI